MIEVRDLKKSYKKHGREVGLLGVSFTVPKGQIVGVLGENGAGKTTLLRTMTGLLPKQSGTVLYDGKPPERQYRRISYLTGEGSYYPWGYPGGRSTRTLDVHIQHLRKKLGTTQRIETIYRIGYRLAG